IAVTLGSGLKALDVRSCRGLGYGICAELDLLAGAKAFRNPAGDLLGGAARGDAGRRQRGALKRKRDTGATPVHLFCVDDRELAVRVGTEPVHQVETVKTPGAGLLQYFPGEAL